MIEPEGTFNEKLTLCFIAGVSDCWKPLIQVGWGIFCKLTVFANREVTKENADPVSSRARALCTTPRCSIRTTQVPKILAIELSAERHCDSAVAWLVAVEAVGAAPVVVG